MRDKYEFLYQGDHGDYAVQFSREGNNLSARCTCPAGQVGQYCKHRFAIIRGETQQILSDNAAEVADIKELVAGTDVEAAMNEVIEAEEFLESAKQELMGKKKKLARAMNN